MSEDRRHFSRILFQSTVTIQAQSGPFQAELIDISLKGALIELKSGPALARGETCFFELRLDLDSVAVKTDAVVVYSKENQLGLRFENLDLDSVTHLRRLVELNVGDSEQVQQELFFLADPDLRD